MKKFFLTFFGICILLLVGSVVYLSVNGHNTSKFNQILTEQIKNKNPELKVSFDKIKVKFNLKKINLYLSTKNPSIVYREVQLPVKDIKIYINFLSLIKSRPEIERATVSSGKIEIENIKKLVLRTKPSNFKSFILNNVKNGNLEGNFDVFFSKNLKVLNYKTNGRIEDLDINYLNKFNILNTSLNFVADNDLILINSLSTNFKSIKVRNGNLEINKEEDLIIDGSIKTSIEAGSKQFNELMEFFINSNSIKNKINIKGNFINKFQLNLSETLEVKDYNFESIGNIVDSKIVLDKKINTDLLKDSISEINFNKSKVKINFNKRDKQKKITLEGFYNFNNQKNEKYKLASKYEKSQNEIDLNLDFNNNLKIDLINYKKEKAKTANIVGKVTLKNKDIHIHRLKYSEGKNEISLNNLKINNKKIISLKKIKIKTYLKNVVNNNFYIDFSDKLYIKGKSYDGRHLVKKLSEKSSNSLLSQINKDVQITFDNILIKTINPLNNFNLIGRIEKGKFTQLSSKSEFENNKYLDISLKKTALKNEKILEIFSDMPEPLIADFNFFNGLQGGKLLFTSIFNDTSSKSSLEINNFTVQDAPGFAKLLSLADFGGISDLLSGEGISFDQLQIKMNKNKELLNVDEIYVVGPSISILMDGYIDDKTGLVSLRGTMVPAKNLNKLISKIPVIGNILIPKEIGEGLFGVSFKIKGRPGELKTSVNPIKTLTPRFITKALEKRKKNN
jgi:hypothetical protein